MENNLLANWFGGTSGSTLLFFFLILVLIYGGRGFAFGGEVGTEGLFGCGSNWIIWLLLIFCLFGNRWC